MEEASNGADDEGVVLAALDGIHALGLALLPAPTNALVLKLLIMRPCAAVCNHKTLSPRALAAEGRIH